MEFALAVPYAPIPGETWLLWTFNWHLIAESMQIGPVSLDEILALCREKFGL